VEFGELGELNKAREVVVWLHSTTAMANRIKWSILVHLMGGSKDGRTDGRTDKQTGSGHQAPATQDTFSLGTTHTNPPWEEFVGTSARLCLCVAQHANTVVLHRRGGDYGGARPHICYS
jgi:hypothetical protein